ncbi:MAG: hypothetical protein QOJ73_1510 [Streptosporangiaceae bacterium]|jgi:hypothetical protein|nr:hypothetical protein [Streptosporangiaceae bacterium]
MTDGTPSANANPTLTSLLAQYGDRCQIEHDDATGVWLALFRPTMTARHYLMASTLSELAAKLGAESPAQQDVR